jgi:hypothetical protein
MFCLCNNIALQSQEIDVQQPHIFSVMVFRMEGGKRRLCLHYVAGMTSADAEARIKERDSAHLTGQCFITTDEHEGNHGTGCKLYTTRMHEGEPMTDLELRRWVRQMTRPCREEGELHPAAFRRFHVEGSRKAAAAHQARLAA